MRLCGPDKKFSTLAHYATTQPATAETVEILSEFQTMFPYLRLIAMCNDIADPFDTRVVEAYWTGNSLLHSVSARSYVNALSHDIGLTYKSPYQTHDALFDKIASGALAHHAFHVLNIYSRTSHLDIHLSTGVLNACIINWGKVIHISSTTVVVTTQTLQHDHDSLRFSAPVVKNLTKLQTDDPDALQLSIGDWVSYHWGQVCERLSASKLENLKRYTILSLSYANK